MDGPASLTLTTESLPGAAALSALPVAGFPRACITKTIRPPYVVTDQRPATTSHANSIRLDSKVERHGYHGYDGKSDVRRTLRIAMDHRRIGCLSRCSCKWANDPGGPRQRNREHRVRIILRTPHINDPGNGTTSRVVMRNGGSHQSDTGHHRCRSGTRVMPHDPSTGQLTSPHSRIS